MSSDSAFEFLRGKPRARLLGEDKPFGKLCALVAASLVERAVDLNLHLSILLKGARGAGKFTVASWVARVLGMHLLEVSSRKTPSIWVRYAESLTGVVCRSTATSSSVKTTRTRRVRYTRGSRRRRRVLRAYSF